MSTKRKDKTQRTFYQKWDAKKRNNFNILKGKFCHRSVVKMIHTTEHHVVFFLSKKLQPRP